LKVLILLKPQLTAYLFVLPFFTLSVLITRRHAQLTPLWLTAGLVDALFRAKSGTLQNLNEKDLQMP